ncbi:DHA2 family efflux MFS transporter permease subunit [Pandoraea nosoerga]|uniref:Multidrug export protein EmrB n=2 Tax=Pandoraea nosoerga TaxID=2508296 RepID=A0A5E4STE2_9BURK|nr:DHA2 family efflux MFS transporter permease subunit [Pandoraea nosoerga]MBN4677622.1 DHA2 family efflux MFS transporter permease subunit [Pandoraea nosoerga]MBN4682544.1 DHA2 family efflux MFS transporter permease subunit [Pandoraea nosoerga]MBN4745593.1 DHA2 family efflux MFS transporter permease subunit [Pandoraea nosoerga]VVD78113.1 Multidrug export protein EmrB [Pandoraea nosoerga]
MSASSSGAVGAATAASAPATLPPELPGQPNPPANDSHSVSPSAPRDGFSAGAMSTQAKVVAFATMVVGMFIALLDIQIVSASLRDIGGGLSAGADETAWVQTSYLIAEIIVIPLSGWLSRVMSTRWIFAASAAGFTVASLLCGAAWNIQSMIAFRALQGFLGGSMIPLVFTTAFAFFTGPQRVLAAAVVGGLSSLAPTLGPTIGGWITDNYSWHWLFFVNLVPGIFVTVTVPLLVRIDRPDWSLLRGADYLGMALMAVCLGCLEYTLEEGPRWDWFGDDTIRTTAWLAGLCGIAFVWRSLAYSRPVVDLRALKDRNFALGCFFSFATGIGIFATIYLTPLFLGRVRGFSAFEIGLAVFSTGIFQLLSIPVYAMLANRVDLRVLMMAGIGAFALSMWQFAPMTHDWGAAQLLLPQALRGAAQQFAVAPIVTLTLGGLPPARLRLASGLFNLMRNLGGAIGIAVCTTVLNDRTNLHFFRLAERMGEGSAALGAWLAGVGARMNAAGLDVADAHTAALRQLWLLTLREAQTITFGDIYGGLGAIFVCVTLMVPLMHRVAPPKAPGADAH